MSAEKAARKAAKAINAALAAARRHGPTDHRTAKKSAKANAALDRADAAGVTTEQIRAARRR